MSFFNKGLLIGALSLSAVGAAHAVPSIVNPNFVPAGGTPAYPYYHAFTGGSEGWTSSGNAGYAPYDTAAFWDNGTRQGGAPGAGVGFLQVTGAYFTQTVAGFSAGERYNLSFLANARSTGSAVLDILMNGVSIFGGGTVISPVNSNGVQTANFNALTSSTFTGPVGGSATIQFLLGTTAVSDGAVLLSAVTLNDLGPVASVPEPMSLALLSAGLVGIYASRRRADA